MSIISTRIQMDIPEVKMSAPNELKVDRVKAKFTQELYDLVSRASAGKATGRVMLTVEISVSQGGIGQWAVDGSLKQVGG